MTMMQCMVLKALNHKINDLHDSISSTENEKQKALKEFEETVKPDILEEIQNRYADKLELMNSELAKKKDEYTKLDDLIKQAAHIHIIQLRSLSWQRVHR